MLSDVRNDVNRQRGQILARDLKPTKLFVDEHTYKRMRMDARESMNCTMRYGTVDEWFEGLRLYRVNTQEYVVVVA